MKVRKVDVGAACHVDESKGIAVGTSKILGWVCCGKGCVIEIHLNLGQL